MLYTYLHENKELFKDIINKTSEFYHIEQCIIEKDYYVTLFLKQMKEIQPNIIFKGGTSLSKAFHIINRFSEDIDLSIEYEGKPSNSQKKLLVNNIKNTIRKYGFSLLNESKIMSRRDYNRYIIDTNSLFTSTYIKQNLIVETALFIKSYPNTNLDISSYIFNYLIASNNGDVIRAFDLYPFKIIVQSKERTFVDKLFAICDYFLADDIDEHSRHLYDLYKLSFAISINDSLVELINNVKKIRKNHKTCLSAQDNINLIDCLKDILLKDIYKNDYVNITSNLTFEKISYSAIKKRLINIIDILFK